MKNTCDYHYHYLKKDVLSPADLFEKFISSCLKFYGLDPCHYFSSTGLSSDVKNDWCKIRKNIRNLQVLSYWKGTLRGGISYIAKRYGKENKNIVNLTGYFLEVNLEYPDELHELHNDYPLAPEKRAVSSDMLSNYCKKIADKYEIKVGDVKKLIPNLGNKTNYVAHYRNLQLYLSLGMKLTKTHRVLKFKQSD